MRSSNEQAIFAFQKMDLLPWILPRSESNRGSEEKFESSEELKVSFGYGCNMSHNNASVEPCKLEVSTENEVEDSNTIMARSSSFSRLSVAALSANFTLADTNICNGAIREGVLPHLDSPKSFKLLQSSPSLSRLDSFSSSPEGISPLAQSTSTDGDLETCKYILKPSSVPTDVGTSTFLNAGEVHLAGGASGEDRVQAVCSEENGWLFCGIYDGFNGRDAADYLASTLYDKTVIYLQQLERFINQRDGVLDSPSLLNSMPCNPDALGIQNNHHAVSKISDVESSSEAFRAGVPNCLRQALAQTEAEFMQRVEEEMHGRPDLVSVGSSVLAVLLHGVDLYTINLGDSRAVLAKTNVPGNDIHAVQITEIHNIDNEEEHMQVLANHPDDPSPVTSAGVKGRLKLTRALGAGFLKKRKLNDVLMGILTIPNLCSPPYIHTHPFTFSHKISENDLFLVLGSDGLFDLINNDEVVNLVYGFIQDNPTGDPAKYLVEQLVIRAAEKSGMSVDELIGIPAGRRRKYHDDLTAVVIILGNKQRTSTASTSL